MKDYPAAIKINGTKHCIPEPVAVDGDHAYCNPPSNAEYVCDVDFIYWVNAAKGTSYSGVPKFYLIGGEYETYRSDLKPNYLFILNMCTKIPTFTSSGDRNDFTPDSIPQIFNYTVCSRPIVFQNFANDLTS